MQRYSEHIKRSNTEKKRGIAMLKEKLTIERKKAVMITADFTAPTTESYAMAWLKLCNNAREYKDVIWRIENDS